MAGEHCQASPPDVVFGPAAVATGFNVPLPAPDSTGVTTFVDDHQGVAAAPIMSSDGHLYVGLVSDPVVHLAELRHTLPDPQLIRAYCARWSQQTIADTVHAVNNDPTLQRQGVTVMGMGGTSTGDQRLQVVIQPYTAATATYIEHRYGAIIQSVVPALPQCGSC